MFKFAESSIRYLKEVDPELQLICHRVKEIAEIDFDISCGYRSIEEQKKAFKAGKSQLDGVTNKSYHNYIPSRAVDIYCYNGKQADYSGKNMAYIAGLFHAVSVDLFERGIIKNKIAWGGWWTDLVDMPHYELV